MADQTKNWLKNIVLLVLLPLIYIAIGYNSLKLKSEIGDFIKKEYVSKVEIVSTTQKIENLQKNTEQNTADIRLLSESVHKTDLTVSEIKVKLDNITILLSELKSELKKLNEKSN